MAGWQPNEDAVVMWSQRLVTSVLPDTVEQCRPAQKLTNSQLILLHGTQKTKRLMKESRKLKQKPRCPEETVQS